MTTLVDLAAERVRRGLAPPLRAVPEPPPGKRRGDLVVIRSSGTVGWVERYARWEGDEPVLIVRLPNGAAVTRVCDVDPARPIFDAIAAPGMPA